MSEHLYAIFKEHPVISTDSRKITNGCLFFALKGENFNGNEYAESALEKGAAYAVVDEPAFAKGNKYILVGNVLEALQQLAKYHRQQFEIPVVAITGSNGKTTTKELTGAVLKSHFKTHVTSGNLNNHIGVPLTLLQMPFDAEMAVIEMGASGIGEIGQLCHIAMPTHGLITNIAKAHLEGFGSLEGVKQAKSELYRYLERNGGVAFVNEDEEYLHDLSEGIRKRVFYGKRKTGSKVPFDFQVELTGESPFLKVEYIDDNGARQMTATKIFGSYNFSNIMTAIVVGKCFGVPAAKISKALEDYIPNNNRSQLLKKGEINFIVDAYNANPSSMRVALDNFSKMPGNFKIVIMGSMLELGSYSEKEHLEIAELAGKLGFKEVICVGSEFKQAAQSQQLRYFPHVEALKAWMQGQNLEGSQILLKGSRRLQLEKILE